MRTLLASALALGAMTSLALAEPPTAAGPKPVPVELTDAQLDRVTAGAAPGVPTDPSWGDLTSAVAGPDLGAHASTETTPRVGLANIIEQGNLAATVEFIDGLGGALP